MQDISAGCSNIYVPQLYGVVAALSLSREDSNAQRDRDGACRRSLVKADRQADAQSLGALVGLVPTSNPGWRQHAFNSGLPSK